MKKSKKLNIIIAVICGVVLLAGIIITTTLLLTRKKFDITPNSIVLYNDHTTMKIARPDTGLTVVADSNPTYYSNGTVLVQDINGKLGIYSYNDNRLIVPATHYNSYGSNYYPITPIELSVSGYNLGTNTNSNKQNTGDFIFKAGASSTGKILFYNDEGTILNVTNVDGNTQETYGYIMQRKMSVKEKRKGIKISTKDKFSAQKISIKDANYVSSFNNEKYTYELWELTDQDNQTYINLYKVENKQRKLVQTINNPLGNDATIIESNISYMPYVLENGKVVIITTTESDYIGLSSSNTILTGYSKISIYDDELNLEETVTFENAENLTYSFVIGNYMYAQYLTPTTEDDYDFAEVSNIDGSINYFSLTTYRLDLKNGKYKDVKFNYLIENINTSFNTDTITLNVRPIKNKSLQKSKILLINSKLQTKEIDYEIEAITKITSKRYLVENDKGLYLIDEDYDLISYLGEYDEYFTTSESIILTDWLSDNTYIVSLDGVVVKKYSSHVITNIYDDKYYMVQVNTEKNGTEYIEYYLERLGIRNSQPIHSQDTSSLFYIYNNKEYLSFDYSIVEDGVSIITRVRENGTGYSYDFFNFEGDLLLTIDNFTTSDRTLIHKGYSDNECHVLYISTATGGEGYTIVVDR